MKPFSHFIKTFCGASSLVAIGLVSTNASAAPIAPTDVARRGRHHRHSSADPYCGSVSMVGSGARPHSASSESAAAAWRLLRRQRRKLAYEIALERLENTRPLMREFHAEPFCLAVSDMVRRVHRRSAAGPRNASHDERISARSCQAF